MKKSAIFSPCRKYRYTLERIWDEKKPPAMFIGLNPSTADEEKDDPTVRRCISFSRIWGYGGLIMTNLFAFRATDPKEMIIQKGSVWVDNDRHLKECAAHAGIVVAAWGNHGQHLHRAYNFVRAYGGQCICCLKLTTCKEPSHPLYQPESLKPIDFETGKPVEVPAAIQETQLEMF
ncbi:MAG TPA: hypothetical protein DHV36_20160 [Desulfobacteraceae bacterium]|nr:hypothetical protein [Desulfobacteraceae bacterium]